MTGQHGWRVSGHAVREKKRTTSVVSDEADEMVAQDVSRQQEVPVIFVTTTLFGPGPNFPCADFSGRRHPFGHACVAKCLGALQAGNPAFISPRWLESRTACYDQSLKMIGRFPHMPSRVSVYPDASCNVCSDSPHLLALLGRSNPSKLLCR